MPPKRDGVEKRTDTSASRPSLGHIAGLDSFQDLCYAPKRFFEWISTGLTN